ncbi:MAG TPA: hypothetical protein VLC79_05810 [Cellvibrio sp.]|nr:hypothetical protein [Cellvibrio sp.]
MRLIKSFFILLMFLPLGACISMKQSTAVTSNGFEQGISIVHSLPKALPGGVSPVPGVPYVFILPDSAATLLVPVPFIGEAVVSQVHQSTSNAYKNKFASADPYYYAFDSLQKTPFYKADNAPYKLYPYVVIQQGFDDVYRASLVYHIEGPNWVGRYLYHLPTTYPKAQFVNTPPAEIKSLQQELSSGADQLTELLKRDDVGKLAPHGKKAKLGSLFIVSSKIAGLVSPEVLAYPNIDIVEEASNYVIARIAGDIKTDGQSGGMMFGIHYFHKNQLHTYAVTAEDKH